jgi:hypothetical protein
MKKIIFILAISLISIQAFAQKATVSGMVYDEGTKKPLEFVTIVQEGTANAVNSKADGSFELKIPVNEPITVLFSLVGYIQDTVTVQLRKGENRSFQIKLKLRDTEEILIQDNRLEKEDGVQISEEEIESIKLIPTISINFETALGFFGLGVNSGTGGELSSQYSVRGGSYDENLIYVNDFEIYRPFLIRSGQQEGLTFPNIDLIRDLTFSSGGFEAKFGDKLSSVLNINYKRPDSLKASVGVSFLGASAHLEGAKFANPNNKSKKAFRYLLGARYKTTQYLLGSLDLQGEYKPNFTDFQGSFTYDFNKRWQLGFIGNYANSRYQFTPETLSTTLGLINFALQFNVEFEGQEIDQFNTYMTGVHLTKINEDKNYYLKFLASKYGSKESERFDIIGHYSLGELETDLGSSDFGEVVSILGTGTEHNYARNYLTADVTNVAHKGGWEWRNKDYGRSTQFMQWGVKYQREIINDQLNEWTRIDSAGYSLFYDTTQVLLNETIKTDINLSSNRFSGFVQNSWSISDSIREMNLTVGVRAQYWDLNGETILMPRFSLQYKPLKWEKDISFKLASGLYHQPPFYRELRNQQGEINKDVVSQKSLHVVTGMTYDFDWAGRPFRLLGEMYYKKLWDVVPYDIDNVRISYYGDNLATGYVTGLDLRLNGEFVKDTESWINLSFLRARESFTGVEHLLRTAQNPDTVFVVKDVPRPTDRFMNLSMFFQDYFPGQPRFKVHTILTVGSGLAFGLPDDNVVFRNIYRFKGYQRVDIGFSALLWDRNKDQYKKPNHILRFTKKTWMSLEVFNLLKISNTASNTWIKTVFLQQYAVPNYLTSRRINLRFKFEF